MFRKLVAVALCIAMLVGSCIAYADQTLPTWNGEDPVVVYEDQYIKVQFKGLQPQDWNGGWGKYTYPRLLVTNKTNENLLFTVQKVYFNSMKVPITNIDAYGFLLQANTVTAYPDSISCWMQMGEFKAYYGNCRIQDIRFTFELRHSLKGAEATTSKEWKKCKKIVSGDFSVQYGANVNVYIDTFLNKPADYDSSKTYLY